MHWSTLIHDSWSRRQSSASHSTTLAENNLPLRKLNHANTPVSAFKNRRIKEINCTFKLKKIALNSAVQVPALYSQHSLKQQERTPIILEIFHHKQRNTEHYHFFEGAMTHITLKTHIKDIAGTIENEWGQYFQIFAITLKWPKYK